jgi:hypothetical protein
MSLVFQDFPIVELSGLEPTAVLLGFFSGLSLGTGPWLLEAGKQS